jgi:membrane protease YdiL (CAAX protease family)
VAAFGLAWLLLAYGVNELEKALVAPGAWWRTAGRGVIGLSAPPLVAALALYGALLGFTPWTLARLRVPAVRASLRGLAVGLGWGVGLAAVVLALSLAGGARLLTGAGGGERYLAVALPVAVGLALAALLEELLFRGFPLARLARAMGPVGASVTLALAFTAAHLGNPDLSALGLANVGAAALLLSAVFFSRQGLPGAVGLHLGWNAGLVLMADAPVSGLRFGLPVLAYAPGPHGWLTGGGFGPEGGLAATVVLLAALWWWYRRIERGTEVAT